MVKAAVRFGPGHQSSRIWAYLPEGTSVHYPSLDPVGILAAREIEDFGSVLIVVSGNVLLLSYFPHYLHPGESYCG
jgi:hypothetical protein